MIVPLPYSNLRRVNEWNEWQNELVGRSLCQNQIQSTSLPNLPISRNHDKWLRLRPTQERGRGALIYEPSENMARRFSLQGLKTFFKPLGQLRSCHRSHHCKSNGRISHPIQTYQQLETKLRSITSHTSSQVSRPSLTVLDPQRQPTSEPKAWAWGMRVKGPSKGIILTLEPFQDICLVNWCLGLTRDISPFEIDLVPVLMTLTLNNTRTNMNVNESLSPYHTLPFNMVGDRANRPGDETFFSREVAPKIIIQLRGMSRKKERVIQGC